LTNLPGVPVNCSATKNGCDRNRWMRRARATRACPRRELLDAEDRDDVAQVLVALQRALHLARHLVVLLADDQRARACARRLQRVDAG
jgi:hypothetical protein